MFGLMMSLFWFYWPDSSILLIVSGVSLCILGIIGFVNSIIWAEDKIE